MKKKSSNQKIAQIFFRIAELLDINGVPYKPAAYRKAAQALETLDKDVSQIYAHENERGSKRIPGIGESMASKIREYLRTKRILFHDELEKKTAIRDVITHFFETKGVSLEQLKRDARKQKIVYSRYTSSAKQLLELSGSLAKAKEAISKVADWATSRGLDYSIETVFKKWLELDRLKPKEVVKKPFYQGMPLVWSETKKKWFVVTPEGEWLEFADEEDKIEWKIM